MHADKEDIIEDDGVDEMEEDKEEETSKSRTGKNFKGRGKSDMRDDEEGRYSGEGGVFHSLQSEEDSPGGPLRSIEGWIIFITGVQEEAQEEDLKDKFAEFGPLKDLVLPLDRRTGYVKGYALIEYETRKEAEAAIADMDGKEFMGHNIKVDWAFVAPQKGGRSSGSGSGKRRDDRGGDRSGNRKRRL